MGQKKQVMYGLMVAWLSIGTSHYVGAASGNQLKKIQHHRNETAKIGAFLELGFLSLYVDQEPTVQILPQVSRTSHEHVFFCPGIIASAESAKAIEQINTVSGKVYQVRVEQVSLPVQGLKIVFTYDPTMVGITYDFFDSIQHQKGIVFRLHDRIFLDQLKKKGAPVLRTAQRPPVVVVDCGHGGSDTGAIGHYQLQEKQVCLNIGTALAHELMQRGITTFLTRSDDVTLALDARTTFANERKADLFVSIHANYAANKNVYGMEIFCQKPSLFHPQMNVSSATEVCDLRRHLEIIDTKSEVAARAIQNAVVAQMQEGGSQLHDRGVKYAVSQVLLGTVMPAVLIEVGFLSHEREAYLLAQDEYQRTLARGMSAGIAHYFSL